MFPPAGALLQENGPLPFSGRGPLSYCNSNNSFRVFLPLPPALARPGIDMHPAGAALRVSGVLRLPSNAAPGGQQGLGVGGDGSHRRTLDVEIRRPAQQVLARLAAAHGGIVLSGAVAAGDRDGLAKVLPIVGAAASGIWSYKSFRPIAERIRLLLSEIMYTRLGHQLSQK